MADPFDIFFDDMLESAAKAKSSNLVNNSGLEKKKGLSAVPKIKSLTASMTTATTTTTTTKTDSVKSKRHKAEPSSSSSSTPLPLTSSVSSSSSSSTNTYSPGYSDLIWIKDPKTKFVNQLAIFCVYCGMLELQPEYKKTLQFAVDSMTIQGIKDSNERGEFSLSIITAETIIKHKIQVLVDQVLSKVKWTDKQRVILDVCQKADKVSAYKMESVEDVTVTCSWSAQKLTQEYSMMTALCMGSASIKSSKKFPLSNENAEALLDWNAFCNFPSQTMDFIRTSVRSHPLMSVTDVTLSEKMDALIEWELISSIISKFDVLQVRLTNFFLQI